MSDLCFKITVKLLFFQKSSKLNISGKAASICAHSLRDMNSQLGK